MRIAQEWKERRKHSFVTFFCSLEELFENERKTLFVVLMAGGISTPTRVYQAVLTLGVLQTSVLDLPNQCHSKSSCVGARRQAAQEARRGD